MPQALGHVEPKPSLVPWPSAAEREGGSAAGDVTSGHRRSGALALPVRDGLPAVLVGPATAPHLAPSHGSVAHDIPDPPCQQSVLMKTLNQSSDDQFQTRSWWP